MEELITNLKNMIENAKKENDEVLVAYLTHALNHILEKQKKQEDIKLKSQENINQEENTIIEEKKEALIENKQEEEKKEEKQVKEEDTKKKEIFNRFFDSEYEKEKKSADFLEMELDELNGKSNKNPTDYEEIISRYNFLIQRLERLYYMTANKVSTEKSQKILETIQDLKDKVTNINKYHIALKEAIEETNRLFEY